MAFYKVLLVITYIQCCSLFVSSNSVSGRDKRDSDIVSARDKRDSEHLEVEHRNDYGIELDQFPSENRNLLRDVIAELPSITDNQFFLRGPKGSYRLGTQSEDQWRAEERDEDGEVKGNYGYLTPEGELVQVDYTSGVNGYQAKSPSIPGGSAGYVKNVRKDEGDMLLQPGHQLKSQQQQIQQFDAQQQVQQTHQFQGQQQQQFKLNPVLQKQQASHNVPVQVEQPDFQGFDQQESIQQEIVSADSAKPYGALTFIDMTPTFPEGGPVHTSYNLDTNAIVTEIETDNINTPNFRYSPDIGDLYRSIWQPIQRTEDGIVIPGEYPQQYIIAPSVHVIKGIDNRETIIPVYAAHRQTK